MLENLVVQNFCDSSILNIVQNPYILPGTLAQTLSTIELWVTDQTTMNGGISAQECQYQ